MVIRPSRSAAATVGGIVAHLKKLEREGVVARVGEAWSIMKP